jgi:hypothetical protein
MASEEDVPDPQKLQAEAKMEPPRRGLEDYHEVIRVLREEKGFSLREIASWLQDRGLQVDHNAVWRTYSRGGREGEAPSALERTERNEHSGSNEGAMPWL